MRICIYLLLVYSVSLSAQSKKELLVKVKTLHTENQMLKEEHEKMKVQIIEIKKSNSTLKVQNEKMKTENIRLGSTAPYLLSKAIELDKKEDYNDAIKSYEKLMEKFPVSKEFVEAKARILTIKKKLEIAKNKKLEEESSKNLVMTHDDFKKRTFYKDSRADRYYRNSFNSLSICKISAYFSIPDKSKKPDNLRLIIGYKADDWLFINKVTFLVDGEPHNITCKFERDTESGGGIFEWCDLNVTNTIYSLITKIINADEVKIRFGGNQYHTDAYLSLEQYEAMKSIVSKYKALGGST